MTALVPEYSSDTVLMYDPSRLLLHWPFSCSQREDRKKKYKEVSLAVPVI